MSYAWVTLPIKQIKVVNHTTGAVDARYTTINDAVRNINLTAFDIVIKFDMSVLPPASQIKDFCRVRWDFIDGSSTYDIGLFPVSKSDTMTNTAYANWTGSKILDPLIAVTETTSSPNAKIVTTALTSAIDSPNEILLNKWILAGHDTMVVSTTRTEVQGYQYYQVTGTTPMSVQVYFNRVETVLETLDVTEEVIFGGTSTLDVTEEVQYTDEIETVETVQVADISFMPVDETVQIAEEITIETVETIKSLYLGGTDTIDVKEYIYAVGESGLNITEKVWKPNIFLLDMTESIIVSTVDEITVTELIKTMDTETLSVSEKIRRKATETLDVKENIKPPVITSKSTLSTKETVREPVLTAEDWFDIPIVQIKTQDRVTGNNVKVYDTYAINHGTVQEQLKTRDIILTIDKEYANLFLNMTNMRIRATLGDVNLSVYPVLIKDVLGSTSTFYPYYKTSTTGEAIHSSVRNITTKGEMVIRDDDTTVYVPGLVRNQRSTLKMSSVNNVIKNWFMKKYVSLVLTSYDVTPTGFPDYKDPSITITDTTQSVVICDVTSKERIKLEVYGQKMIPAVSKVQTINTTEYIKYVEELKVVEGVIRPNSTQTITVKETVSPVSHLPTSEDIIAYDGEIDYIIGEDTIRALEQIVSPSTDVRQLRVSETILAARKPQWHRIPIKQVKVISVPNLGGSGIPISDWSNGPANVTWNYGNEPEKSDQIIYDPSGNQNFLPGGEIGLSGPNDHKGDITGGDVELPQAYAGQFVVQAWNSPSAQIVSMNDYCVVVKLDREYMDKLTDIQRARFEVFAYHYEGDVTALLVDDQMGDDDYLNLSPKQQLSIFTTPYGVSTPSYTQYPQEYTSQVEHLKDWYRGGHDSILLGSFFSKGNFPQIYASNLNASQDMDFWVYGIEQDTSTPYKTSATAIFEVMETITTGEGIYPGEWVEIPVDQVKFADWQTGNKVGATSDARSSMHYEWIDTHDYNIVLKLNEKALSSLSVVTDIKIVATTYNYDGHVTLRLNNDMLLKEAEEGRYRYIYYNDHDPNEIQYVEREYNFPLKYFRGYKDGLWHYAGYEASVMDLPVLKYWFRETEGFKMHGSAYSMGEALTVSPPVEEITTSTWTTSRIEQRKSLSNWFNTEMSWFTHEPFSVTKLVKHDTIMLGSSISKNGKIYCGDINPDYQIRVYMLSNGKKIAKLAKLENTEEVVKREWNTVSNKIILDVKERIVAYGDGTIDGSEIENVEYIISASPFLGRLSVSETVIYPTSDKAVLIMGETVVYPTSANSKLPVSETVAKAISVKVTLSVLEIVAKATIGKDTLYVLENIVYPTSAKDTLFTLENVVYPVVRYESLSVREIVRISNYTSISVYELIEKYTASEDTAGEEVLLTKRQRKLKQMNTKITDLINDYGSPIKLLFVNLYDDKFSGLPGGTIIDEVSEDIKGLVTSPTPQVNPYLMVNSADFMVSAYECYIDAKYYKTLARWGWNNIIFTNLQQKCVFIEHKGLWYRVNIPELNSIGDQDMYIKLTMTYSPIVLKYTPQ